MKVTAYTITYTGNFNGDSRVYSKASRDIYTDMSFLEVTDFATKEYGLGLCEIKHLGKVDIILKGELNDK